MVTIQWQDGKQVVVWPESVAPGKARFTFGAGEGGAGLANEAAGPSSTAGYWMSLPPSRNG
ncbi:MAG: hypothetical protein DMD83_26960 [Candidatus Rokuibacteriota bacterium]|nr:MAG: hypothetical protein DMD83_26960 [Candidatus Rokubacteria bacterium]